MSDSSLQQRIELVLRVIGIIEKRMRKIHTADDFVADDDGLTMMDAVAMRLQQISETVKKIDKAAPDLLPSAGVDVKSIIRFRDFISHHYDEADYEVLFDICKIAIPELKMQLLKIV